MNNKILNIFFLIAVGSVFGFICYGSLENQIWVNAAFYNVKITELAQLFFTIVIGGYISLKISIKSRIEVKRREIYLELLDSLQNRLSKMYIGGCDYMHGTFEGEYQEILSRVKSFSQHISLVDDVIVSENSVSKILPVIIEKFLKMKTILTGDEFNVTSPSYSRSDFIEFDKIYNDLNSKIIQIKVGIFT